MNYHLQDEYGEEDDVACSEQSSNLETDQFKSSEFQLDLGQES